MLCEGLGGNATAGMGFGTGIEGIILDVRAQEIQLPEVAVPCLYVAFMGDQARIPALLLADQARRKGIPAVSTLSPRSLKAQMKQANNLRVRYAFILGEQEIADGTVTVRDMAESTQWQEARETALARILPTKG